MRRLISPFLWVVLGVLLLSGCGVESLENDQFQAEENTPVGEDLASAGSPGAGGGDLGDAGGTPGKEMGTGGVGTGENRFATGGGPDDVVGVGRPSKCDYDVLLDQWDTQVEYEVTAKAGWYTDTWSTPVTTADGETYFTYVGEDLRARVGKLSNGGAQDFALDDAHLVTDDGHNEFSLAVDKEGFIHIVGDMHNNTLRYWRSKAPHDVSSFERHFGAIDGSFSYYFFRVDRAGELYMVARALALNVYYKTGGRGVGLYHYDAASRSWAARGGLAPHPDAQQPVIFWEDSGRAGTSYQMFKADLRFDFNNRMHFGVTTNLDDAANTHNYAIYAYSDDGGMTFSTPGTGTVALPMGIEGGAGQVEPIAGYPNADMGEHATIFVDYDSAPGVVYSIDGATWMRRQLPASGGFSEAVQLKPGTCSRCLALFDEQGVLTLVDGGTLWRARDFGDGFVPYSVGATLKRWDLRALRDENVYRGVSWDSSTGRFQVVRLDLRNSSACEL